MKQAIYSFLLASGAYAYRTFHGDKVFRIKDAGFSENHLATLQRDFGDKVDVWSQKRGAVDIHVDGSQIPRFHSWMFKQNLESETFIEDVQALVDNETKRDRRVSKSVQDIRDFDYTTYHTYEEIQDWA